MKERALRSVRAVLCMLCGRAFALLCLRFASTHPESFLSSRTLLPLLCALFFLFFHFPLACMHPFVRLPLFTSNTKQTQTNYHEISKGNRSVESRDSRKHFKRLYKNSTRPVGKVWRGKAFPVRQVNWQKLMGIALARKL